MRVMARIALPRRLMPSSISSGGCEAKFRRNQSVPRRAPGETAAGTKSRPFHRPGARDRLQRVDRATASKQTIRPAACHTGCLREGDDQGREHGIPALVKILARTTQVRLIAAHGHIGLQGALDQAEVARSLACLKRTSPSNTGPSATRKPTRKPGISILEKVLT